jgi:hypothetical protein
MKSTYIAKCVGAFGVALVLWTLSLSQAMADPNCTCRYSGQEVGLNQRVHDHAQWHVPGLLWPRAE